MQFCKDCGGVLNLFGKSDRELCPACIQNQKTVVTPPPLAKESTLDFLSGAVLTLENGKMILRSKEGWELWSGTDGTTMELKTIFQRAERIYVIRLRRQKN
jgi:hypothetical protein